MDGLGRSQRLFLSLFLLFKDISCSLTMGHLTLIVSSTSKGEHTLNAPNGGLFDVSKGAQEERVPRDSPSHAAGECAEAVTLTSDCRSGSRPLPSGWLPPSLWGFLQSCLLPSSPVPCTSWEPLCWLHTSLGYRGPSSHN